MQEDQLMSFRLKASSEYLKLSSAISILDQLLSSKWVGVGCPEGLDTGFWGDAIKQLSSEWKVLPKYLRFDSVKLKRELINPDYEHLWLEFLGVSYSNNIWQKLELRLGASFVDSEKFSLFPKFEIPLIDGKHKPFESWYPESYDDFGGKFELRFSLEKGVFDFIALSKLSRPDQAFVLQLIRSVPLALENMEKQAVDTRRPIKVWKKFADDSINIIDIAIKKIQKKKIISNQNVKDDAAANITSNSLKNITTNNDLLKSNIINVPATLDYKIPLKGNKVKKLKQKR